MAMPNDNSIQIASGGEPPGLPENDLRVYDRSDISAILAGFVHRHPPRQTQRRHIQMRFGELVVRDSAGVYWAADPYLMRWFIHGNNGWVAGAEPAWPVEASTRAAIYLPAPSDPALNGGAPMPQSKPGDMPGATTRAMERIVAQTYADYRAGHLDLRMTEDLLRQFVVVDRSASIWAVGCRSGQWYRFSGRQWHAEGSPPRDADLPKPEELEALGDAARLSIMRLLASDAPFPCEAVSAPWQPPPVMPALSIGTVRCASCGADLASGQRFCTQCGASRADPGLVCASCGAALKPGQKYCTHCGAAVGS